MDLEILELVNKALASLTSGEAIRAENILRDIVSIYDERMDTEAPTPPKSKVTIGLMSYPEVILAPQVEGAL
jgi:hypothetical protein